MMKAKTAEVEALTESIEEKTKRIGELGVEVVGLKQDLSDCICFGHVKMSCHVCVHRSKCQHFCENLTNKQDQDTMEINTRNERNKQGSNAMSYNMKYDTLFFT